MRKDANRRGSHEHTSFTFLGYEFRPRSAENRNGQLFTTFSPAIGPDALKAKGQQVRDWRIHKRVESDLAELAAWINPVVRGWMNYYGKFTTCTKSPGGPSLITGSSTVCWR